jgi:hypothetical protein
MGFISGLKVLMSLCSISFFYQHSLSANLKSVIFYWTNLNLLEACYIEATSCYFVNYCFSFLTVSGAIHKKSSDLSRLFGRHTGKSELTFSYVVALYTHYAHYSAPLSVNHHALFSVPSLTYWLLIKKIFIGAATQRESWPLHSWGF